MIGTANFEMIRVWCHVTVLSVLDSHGIDHRLIVSASIAAVSPLHSAAANECGSNECAFFVCN